MLATPSPDHWRGRRVLVTGHTGFKGAWLTAWLDRLGAEVTGLALDPDPSALAAGHGIPVLRHDLRSDICDTTAVEQALERSRPQVIFHLAAQALVQEGYRDPRTTFAVNALGTSTLLESVAATGGSPVIVVITSDKVYANDGLGRAFTEDDALGGSDPYSLSKVFAEQVVVDWRRRNPHCTIVTARAGNVIGGGDRGKNRILVDLADALLADRPLELRNPSSHRPWQHVLDAVRGYLLYAEHASQRPGLPTSLNFGPSPDQRVTVAELVDLAIRAWGSGSHQVDPAPHPPEAPLLALDPRRAAEALAWQVELSLPEAVGLTIDWLHASAAGDSIRQVMNDQLSTYLRRSP